MYKLFITAAAAALFASAVANAQNSTVNTQKVLNSGTSIEKLDSSGAATPSGIYQASQARYAACLNQEGCITTGNSDPNSNELFTFLLRSTKQYNGRNEWPFTIDAYNNQPNGEYLPFNSTVRVGANGGPTWAGDFNIVLDPGSATQNLQRGVEIDLTNQAGDFNGTGHDAYGLWVQAGGNHENTAGIQIDSETGTNGGAAGWQYGLWFGSAYGKNGNARVADILDSSSAQVAIDIGRDPNYGTASLNHSTATLRDSSTSPVALQLNGSYSNAAIDTSASSTPDVLHAKPGQKVCLNYNSD